MKICNKCNLELNEECFPIKQIMPGGKRSYRGTCKICRHIEKMPYIVTLPFNTKVCNDCNNLKSFEEIAKGTSKCIKCYNFGRRREPKTKEVIEYKTCNTCKIEKHIDDFGNRYYASGLVGKVTICKPCENIERRERSKLKKQTVVKDERYYIDLERRQEITKNNNKINRLRKYKITLEELNIMETEQNNKCYLCSKEALYSTYGTLCIDHCHKSGKVRKLLCSGCNALLGAAKDNPEFLRKCATYIEDFS